MLIDILACFNNRFFESIVLIYYDFFFCQKTQNTFYLRLGFIIIKSNFYPFLKVNQTFRMISSFFFKL